jgi:predicted amidophosphoribosyltransferase
MAVLVGNRLHSDGRATTSRDAPSSMLDPQEADCRYARGGDVTRGSVGSATNRRVGSSIGSSTGLGGAIRGTIPRVDRLARVAGFLQELVLPVDCAGCGRAGPALCPDCRQRLRPEVTPRVIRGTTVWSALPYAGVVQPVVVAFKNEGRTGLAAPLAAALRAAVTAAVAEVPGDDLLLVPMARTRRSAVERGYDPVRLLLRRSGLPHTDALRLVRRPEDQLRLGREERFANLEHGMAARIPLAGHRVLLVDDVVTTGATLTEARRSVHDAGGTVLGAATVASTPLR